MGGFEFLLTPGTGNVKGTHPSPTAGEGWGTRKFKYKFKFKNRVKTTSKTKQLQDELPEWYHRWRDEVNCGKYGHERPGHPPELQGNHGQSGESPGTGPRMRSNHGASRPARIKNHRDSVETGRNVRLVKEIYTQLRKASPGSSGQTAGKLAVDIGDLLSVGRNHRDHVMQLLQMKFPQDRERFLKLLARFEVNLLFENQWHLSSLKRLLPRLVRDAYRSSSKRTPKKSRSRRH